MKAVVGVWKDDPCKNLQLYEFNNWGEALSFYKQQRKNFLIMYHMVSD